jgi:cation transporter-like permease
MDETHRPPWVRAVVLAGVMYAIIGVAFAWPATHARVWRLAAWLVSAAAFAAHIGYERSMLRNPPRRAALHVALAVALGAFGLAVGAIVHSQSVVSTTGHRRLLLVALVVWPVMTGLPAFLVALVASTVLRRLTDGEQSS